MVEDCMRGRICHAIPWYAEATNKYMKDYDEHEKLVYVMYLGVSNLYGWAIYQNLPLHSFKYVKSTSQFNEDFIKRSKEDSYIGYLLEVDVQ